MQDTGDDFHRFLTFKCTSTHITQHSNCIFTQYVTNTVYLYIARATGGSVHTMDQDLTDLAKLNEGEIVTIGTKKYVITNGKFVLLSSL